MQRFGFWKELVLTIGLIVPLVFVLGMVPLLSAWVILGTPLHVLIAVLAAMLLSARIRRHIERKTSNFIPLL